MRLNDYTYEPKREYVNCGSCPGWVTTDFSNDIQGICNDGNGLWYISHGAGSLEYEKFIGSRNYGAIHAVPVACLAKKLDYKEEKQQTDCLVYSNGVLEKHRFYKYYDEFKNPTGMKIGEIHFGDIDFFNGYLFVPVYQNGKEGNVDAQILIIDAQTFDCVWQERLLKKENTYFERHAWCAVNPLDGCLYTSDSHISSSFDGGNSPVMAYKINFDNLKKRQYPVFKCVNKKGIELKYCPGGNLGIPKKTYELKAATQGGCFDMFDTLYLTTGYGKHQEHDGVAAFVLQRDNESSMKEFVQKRAYYIWMEKGCPLQSKEEMTNDWLEASWQITSAVQSGFIRLDGAVTSGLLCPKANDSEKSAIDFSFDGSSKTKPEEPEGITYWDVRRTAKNANNLEGWEKGCLHALKLHNNDDSLIKGSDSYSMVNYVMKNLETPMELLEYDSKSLRIDYNPVSNRWVVLCKDSEPLKEFESVKEAENALKLFRQFKQLYRFGRYSSDEKNYDFYYDVLVNDGVTAIDTHGIEKKSFHFDDIRLDDNSNVTLSKWKSDYSLVVQLIHFKDYGEGYQCMVLPMNNQDQGCRFGIIQKHLALVKKSKDFYLNYLESSSGKNKDNIYWFE